MAKKTGTLLESIELFLKKQSIKFDINKRERSIIVSFQTESVAGAVDMIFEDRVEGYVIFTYLNTFVSKEKHDEVAKLICDINREFVYGGFDFIAPPEGAIRYKVYVDCNETEVSEEILSRAISVSLQRIEDKADDIYRTILK